MLSGEVANSNLIVFGLTWPGVEPNHTRVEETSYSTTDEDNNINVIFEIKYITIYRLLDFYCMIYRILLQCLKIYNLCVISTNLGVGMTNLDFFCSKYKLYILNHCTNIVQGSLKMWCFPSILKKFYIPALFTKPCMFYSDAYLCFSLLFDLLSWLYLSLKRMN